MPLINKDSAIRCLIYVILTLLAYNTGLIKGKILYYAVGKFTGCNMLASLGIGTRCVINQNFHLLLEITDEEGNSTYTLIDKL